LGVYLPRTALAAVLIVTAFGLIDREEIVRIWRGARGDALIMLTTLLATLFLPLQFAVLAGIFFSFARYIIKTSVPRVYAVLPGQDYKHFVEQQPHQVPCPQMGMIKILGDLYFGAVNHVEEAIKQHLVDYPDQRFLLLRMQGVNQCDLRGVEMLEAVRAICQERGGDLYFVKTQPPVLETLQSTGFYHQLGEDHFLEGHEESMAYLFYKILNPAICIYECRVKIFAECQNLPKQSAIIDVPSYNGNGNGVTPKNISAEQLQQKLLNGAPTPLIVDVRQPREFKQDHIPQAQSLPLSEIVSNSVNLPANREVVLVCQSGSRSRRAAYELCSHGYDKVNILDGGMLSWQAFIEKSHFELELPIP
jgi:SulP family sulfate permease